MGIDRTVGWIVVVRVSERKNVYVRVECLWLNLHVTQLAFCGLAKSGRKTPTKLSSSVQTLLAHSFTIWVGSPGCAKSTSKPSHQHFRCGIHV